MSSPRRFLVTGATTPLGRVLMARLATVGEVVGVRAPNEPAPSDGCGIELTADLTRNAEARKVLAGLAAEAEIDTLVHLGSTSVPEHPCAAPTATSTRLLLDGAEQAPSIRGFVLCSSALVYRLRHDDALLIHERHPLDFSSGGSPERSDRLQADVTASQRVLDARLHIAVLRLSPLVGDGASGELADYLRLRPCYRPLGFDPMVNGLSLDDAAEAVSLAAQAGARGIFNVAGADTLPLSELALRAKARCRAVPGALIASLLAARGVSRDRYRSLHGLLHHGLVVDDRLAREAFAYAPSHGMPAR